MGLEVESRGLWTIKKPENKIKDVGRFVDKDNMNVIRLTLEGTRYLGSKISTWETRNIKHSGSSLQKRR